MINLIQILKPSESDLLTSLSLKPRQRGVTLLDVDNSQKKAQPAPDGRDPAKITGRFRADFRLAIMMVCARRAAAMQLGSGLPDASIRGLRLPLPSTRDSDGS